MIIIPAEVKDAVNHIEGQLSPLGVSPFPRLVPGDLSADHEFAFETFGLRCTQGERDDIGRLIVVQELAIEPMRRRVIDKSKTV